MGKGSRRRPRLVSREEEDLRWAYYKQGRDGYPKMSKAEFDKRLAELKKKGK